MFNTRLVARRIASPSIASTAALTLALVVCSGCVRSETRERAEREASPPASVKTGGTIEGRIQHPGHVIPPMRICAIGSGAPDEATQVCVRTRRDQASYRIEGLPADDYIVIAQTDASAPLYRVGGHVQQVQCIRAPCLDMPAGVSVGENARVEGIDINQFYDKREDFPALRSD